MSSRNLLRNGAPSLNNPRLDLVGSAAALEVNAARLLQCAAHCSNTLEAAGYELQAMALQHAASLIREHDLELARSTAKASEHSTALDILKRHRDSARNSAGDTGSGDDVCLKLGYLVDAQAAALGVVCLESGTTARFEPAAVAAWSRKGGVA